MSFMNILLWFLNSIVGLGIVICYVLVLIKIFQSGDSTMGIICLVALLCCGIGFLVAFIAGWIKKEQYGTQQIMPIWTVLAVIGLLLGGTSYTFLV
jgi:hypothetical protein